MGLFSNKNKRDRAVEDSGRFYSKDDDAAIGERARAKRASNAGASAGAGKSTSRRQASDPMLPEKKRARRRLVGAIALALAAAVGLPMLLDSSPKPLAGDIAIQIPAKDKAPALPVPAAPGDADGGDSAAAGPIAPAALTPPPLKAAASTTPRDRTVTAVDSVDRGEEVVAAPPASRPEPRKAEPKPEPRFEPKPEHRDAKAEHRDAKPETRSADKSDWTDKADKPAKARFDAKPAKPHDDSTRALAILEGKASDSKAAAPAAQKSVLQVAAMSSPEKAAEVQARLRGAGISSYTEKSAGGLIRVKVAFSKDEAEKVRTTLARLGL